ncbi:hypothetical protein DFJ74DRAFT_671964 [Hyaloraphidium curvatum]|nr:hypothetical protein DFJ74DRAFT_671964 [Hyaloraphidium curvatum]
MLCGGPQRIGFRRRPPAAWLSKWSGLARIAPQGPISRCVFDEDEQQNAGSDSRRPASGAEVGFWMAQPWKARPHRSHLKPPTDALISRGMIGSCAPGSPPLLGDGGQGERPVPSRPESGRNSARSCAGRSRIAIIVSTVSNAGSNCDTPRFSTPRELRGRHSPIRQGLPTHNSQTAQATGISRPQRQGLAACFLFAHQRALRVG